MIENVSHHCGVSSPPGGIEIVRPAAPSQVYANSSNRIAFTLMELLVCLAVISALMGMAFPIMASARNHSDISSTRILVQAVSVAVAQYPLKSWTVYYDDDGDDANRDGLKDSDPTQPATPPRPFTGRIFDCNQSASGFMAGDGLLDGSPAVTADVNHDGPFWIETIRSGYGGFLAMTHAPVAPRNIYKGQVVDAWKRPLRIAWAMDIYGPNSFGIWSAGKDGVDGTEDDIRSWSENHD